jgi:hypothetical protein
MKKWMVLFLIFSGSAFPSNSQQGPNPGNSPVPCLNLFIDCSDCDLDYIRTSFRLVNYVNDDTQADVYLLISDISTGSGGTAFSMIFKGQNRFSGMTDTLNFSTSSDYTEDQIREQVLDKIEIGLVPYLLKTNSAGSLHLLVDQQVPLAQDQSDPWKSWVFEIYGTGSFSSQKTGSDLSLIGSIYTSKITDKVKFESGNSVAYSNTSLNLYDGDSVYFTMESRQKDFSSRNLFVYSLGAHTGIGGKAILRQSDYSNLALQVVAGPAFEINLFDYSEASRRQFRFLYSLNYEHSNYADTTVQNKMRDDLFRQQLDIVFSFLDQWGTVSAYAFANSYLSNLHEYSLGASVVASVRLFRGVSLTFSGSCSYYQNQISLKKDVGDLSEILTGRTELEKGLDYRMTIGLSYRFGSINNNTVNPRFEM